MPVLGVKNFVGERLTQAKNARGISAVALSEIAEVSQSSISLYEKGKQNPRYTVVESLAKALNVPVDFFFKELGPTKPKKLFYRSMAASTKSSRELSEAKYYWLVEAVDYLLEYFDLPELDIPDFDLPSDFRLLTTFEIESIAEQLRAYWNLGSGPISNMVRTLESHGIIVWRTKFGALTQDAFSEYREPHPFVVLSTDKENYFRSRFDAAHELGHLILHRSIDQSSLKSAADHKLMEDQAHRFAGAFLVPATQFYNDLYTINIDTFRSLKPKWNVSIAMQIMRVKHLHLINEDEEKRLWINLGRRKWRQVEPLDDSVPQEKPRLVNQSIKMLIDSGVKSPDQISKDLTMSPVSYTHLTLPTICSV